MEKIKRPNWDSCNEYAPMEFKSLNIPLSHDFSIDINLTIAAYYKGRMITILIENKLSETKFEGIITGFEPPSETYENLLLNDKIAIDRDHICGILRTV